MADDTLGFIRLVALNYAPINYAICNGSIMQIVQNQALFSLLGKRFGGDGKVTFALPKIPSTIPNCIYIICINGLYPVRQ